VCHARIKAELERGSMVICAEEEYTYFEKKLGDAIEDHSSR